MSRIVLAVLVALAVASAPVGSVLAAAHAQTKAAMEDCHGKKSGDDHSCCHKTACSDTCGIKCCKLLAMLTLLPRIEGSAFAELQLPEPRRLPAWQLRPRPPPPRA